MKKWFNYFVYVSLVFLIIALIKADYLVIPTIQNHFYLVVSILFVCFGFFFDAFSWYKTLRSIDFEKVNITEAIASSGLSIFGKYIPGKLWIIIGRSAYIAKKQKLSETDTAAISLNAQFISLWVGLLLGILGLIFFGSKYYLAELAVLIWAFITVLLFSKVFHNLFTRLIKRIFKKTIVIPSLKINSVIRVLPWFFVTWLFWCSGFYFLIISLSPIYVAPFAGLAFALAGILGILALVVPGGLGVREGILVTLLIMAGLDEVLAISISVSSRLWFLIGEVFIFLVAFLLEHKRSILKFIKNVRLKMLHSLFY